MRLPRNHWSRVETEEGQDRPRFCESTRRFSSFFMPLNYRLQLLILNFSCAHANILTHININNLDDLKENYSVDQSTPLTSAILGPILEVSSGTAGV